VDGVSDDFFGHECRIKLYASLRHVTSHFGPNRQGRSLALFTLPPKIASRSTSGR
jgi:hypothetical protein